MRRLLPLWLPLLLVPALWLVPLLMAPDAFPFSPVSAFSDLTITHWTNALFIHRSIFSDGTVPLWNSMLLGGTPLAGDPLSGLYYPPLWLTIAFPDPWAFNLLLFLHLGLAGCGTYVLARAEGASRAAALLAGIAFGGASKFAAHIAAGHFTLVCAVAWTPWLMLAARRAIKGGVRQAALAGALAGLIFLADPRWILPAGLAALAYACMASPFSSIKKLIIAGAVGLVCAAGVGAVLAAPMYGLLSASSRSTLSAADNMTLSLPVRSLAGFLVPQIGGSLEWIIYPGALVLLLAVLGACAGIRKMPDGSNSESPGSDRKNTWFWTGLFVLAVLFALGDSTPVYPFLARTVPGLGLLRVPPRWMFLAGLALAMLAYRGWGGIEARLAAQAQPGWFAKALFGIAAAGAMIALIAMQMRLPAQLILAGGAWCLSGLTLWLVIFYRPRKALAAGVALLILCVDLAMADGKLIQPRSLKDGLAADQGAIAQQIADMAPGYRVYSPSYSIPQDASVFYGLRTIHGVSPLILQSTASTVLAAAGISSNGYSVTLPPFASGDPAGDNHAAVPDARALGLLHVRYMVSAFPIQATGWTPLDGAPGSYLYEDGFARARVWVAEDLAAWQDPVAGRAARIDHETANNLRISATGPGVLILSDAAYPGWQATVDGAAVPVETAGGWWRAVQLGAGAHLIEMRFAPLAQYLGLAVTLITLVCLAGVMRWTK